jgi:adenylate cyclase
MSEETPESREGQAPTSPAAAVQPPPSGTNDGAPHASGHVHAHHSALQFRFLEQLKHRNVIRVGVLYLVVCWLILDPIHVLFHMLDVPVWANRLVVVLMAVGFPAVLLFAWVYEITPEGLKPTAEVDPHRSIRKLTGQRLNRAIVVVMAVALAYFVVDKFWLSKHVATEEPATAVAAVALHTAPAATAISAKSVAVLPFLDMSEKKDQDYFAEGMAEEILDILAKTPQLTVIGRTSSFQFKGRTADLRTIGERLGAAYVVEGSVRKAGNRIRVTAQLIDAQSGAHMWSDSYDRDYGDVLTLQDEIATAVARALQLTIDAHDARPLGPGHGAEAYTLYLRGKLALDKFSASSLLEAQSTFQQVLELDPLLLPAAEGLAMTYLLRGVNENDIAGRDAWEQARYAAKRALGISTRSAIAHGVLGFVAGLQDFDWATAETEFHTALALNPNDPDTLQNAAQIAAMHGDKDQAQRRINTAVVIDPLNANAYQLQGLLLYMTGDYPAAESALRKSLAINPEIDGSHLTLGYIRLLHGEWDAALKEFMADPESSSKDVGLAFVGHSLGKKRESDAALARVVEEVGKIWAYGIALIHAYRGERDQAFEWLERSRDARDGDLSFVRTDPLLASLHDDPRWAELMKSMNLPN